MFHPYFKAIFPPARASEMIVESSVSSEDAVAKCATLCTLPERPSAVGQRIMSNWKNPDPNKVPGSFVTQYPKSKYGVVAALKKNAIAIKYDDGSTAEVRTLSCRCPIAQTQLQESRSQTCAMLSRVRSRDHPTVSG